MKALILAAALATAPVLAGVSLAQPMPSLLSLTPAKVLTPGLVQKVDYACGRGWRLTRWGECVPRRGPPPRYYRPPPPDWGWGPPPPRFRPPPPRGDWGPPPRGDWGPPPPPRWGPPRW